MRMLLGAVAIFVGASMSVSADEVVNVSSLKVKERIQTMEQINVSSELDKQEEAPTSEAVAELLEEATQIESEAEGS